jgi:hypothetical protein
MPSKKIFKKKSSSKKNRATGGTLNEDQWKRPTWVEEENVIDYLSEDDSVPSQQFVCLSFCSLKGRQKEESIQNFCDKNGYDRKATTDIIERWCDFENPFRSIKVRGCYGDWDEANRRVQYLRRVHDGNHFIYVGEVGKWGPFDPDPDKIKNQNYYEQQLNTLHEGYEMNRNKTKEHFETRKQELVRKARLEGSKWGQDHLLNQPEPIQAVEYKVNAADEQIKEFQAKIDEAIAAKELALKKLEHMKQHPELVLEPEDIEEAIPEDVKDKVLSEKPIDTETIEAIDTYRKMDENRNQIKTGPPPAGVVAAADQGAPSVGEDNLILPHEARKDITENYPTKTI